MTEENSPAPDPVKRSQENARKPPNLLNAFNVARIVQQQEGQPKESEHELPEVGVDDNVLTSDGRVLEPKARKMFPFAFDYGKYANAKRDEMITEVQSYIGMIVKAIQLIQDEYTSAKAMAVRSRTKQWPFDDAPPEMSVKEIRKILDNIIEAATEISTDFPDFVQLLFDDILALILEETDILQAKQMELRRYMNSKKEKEKEASREATKIAARNDIMKADAESRRQISQLKDDVEYWKKLAKEQEKQIESHSEALSELNAKWLEETRKYRTEIENLVDLRKKDAQERENLNKDMDKYSADQAAYLERVSALQKKLDEQAVLSRRRKDRVYELEELLKNARNEYSHDVKNMASKFEERMAGELVKWEEKCDEIYGHFVAASEKIEEMEDLMEKKDKAILNLTLKERQTELLMRKEKNRRSSSRQSRTRARDPSSPLSPSPEPSPVSPTLSQSLLRRSSIASLAQSIEPLSNPEDSGLHISAKRKDPPSQKKRRPISAPAKNHAPFALDVYKYDATTGQYRKESQRPGSSGLKRGRTRDPGAPRERVAVRILPIKSQPSNAKDFYRLDLVENPKGDTETAKALISYIEAHDPHAQGLRVEGSSPLSHLKEALYDLDMMPEKNGILVKEESSLSATGHKPARIGITAVDVKSRPREQFDTPGTPSQWSERPHSAHRSNPDNLDLMIEASREDLGSHTKSSDSTVFNLMAEFTQVIQNNEKEEHEIIPTPPATPRDQGLVNHSNSASRAGKVSALTPGSVQGSHKK